MRIALAAAAVVISTGFVAGCTSSGSRVERPTSRPSTGVASTHAKAAGALPAGVVGATKVPASVPNSSRLRADVVLSSCSARSGGWSAGGRVRNSSRTRMQHYEITVFFTTDEATVIGTGATTVAVPPARSRPWSLSARFHAPTRTLCVLRGVGPPRHRSHA
jgi:hypothetical protein